MKKAFIILGSLLIVLTFAVSGYSKETKSRKLAQAGAAEKVIGSLTAVERTFGLSFDLCAENTKLIENKGGEKKFECHVHFFPETGEEAVLSDSSDGVDTTMLIKRVNNSDIVADLHIYCF